MRCVFYIRMSKEIQENSPDSQRKALTEYSRKQGYDIVGEYLDEGISGDKTEKRVAFQQMIQDCRLKRFDVILCWDQDRFGRFDPLEAGYWVKPMRDAGVALETIAQGRIDWNDFAGRIVWSVHQEAKHAFLRDLARNSLRGNINRAKSGKHTGRPPYGYVVDENGVLQLGDDLAVAAVRRAFELRTLRLGYRVIGLKLSEEGFPAPGGGAFWSPDAVRIILNREIYTGCMVYGRRHRGKYSTMVDGVVSPSTGGVNKNNPSPIRVEGSHTPIIDRETWRITHAMHRDPPRPHANAGNSGAPLAGLLRCGRCGGPMYSQSLQRAAGQKNPNYICGSYMLGRGCGYCVVSQERMHELVGEKLREALGGSREALVEDLRRKLEERRGKSAVGAMKRTLASLEKKIQAAEGRLLQVHERLFDALQCQILELKDRRNELVAAITDTTDDRVMDPEYAADILWRLPDLIGNGDPQVVRSELRKVLDHVVLNFTAGKKTGRGQSFVFTDCLLVLRQSS